MNGIVPPGLLVTPAQLTRYNVPSAFMSQFALRPFTLVISTGGGLGVMCFTWQYPGDAAQSAPFQSVAGSTWAYTLEDAFADLTFATRTYAVGESYSVDPNGLVTTSAAGLTATRFSLPANACSAVTSDVMTRMQDAITAPLLTWGDDVVTHAAWMVYAILKRGKGATPDRMGGDGDDNIFSAEKTAQKYFDSIGMNGRPANMIDSSISTDGPLFAAYPISDTARGW